jgi:hypothetical protein
MQRLRWLFFCLALQRCRPFGFGKPEGSAVYDQAGSPAETGFTVWWDAVVPTAPTDPLINGGEAWDQDGTVTLTWGQVSDGQSGLEGYYAALGDEAPTVQADSVISDDFSRG